MANAAHPIKSKRLLQLDAFLMKATPNESVIGVPVSRSQHTVMDNQSGNLNSRRQSISIHLPKNNMKSFFCKSPYMCRRLVASNLNHRSSYVALKCSINPAFNFFTSRSECRDATRITGSSFIDIMIEM